METALVGGLPIATKIDRLLLSFQRQTYQPIDLLAIRNAAVIFAPSGLLRIPQEIQAIVSMLT
jgi:hypothetical protein